MKLTVYAGWFCLLDHSHPMLLLLDTSGEWEETEMRALSDDDNDARIGVKVIRAIYGLGLRLLSVPYL